MKNITKLPVADQIRLLAVQYLDDRGLELNEIHKPSPPMAVRSMYVYLHEMSVLYGFGMQAKALNISERKILDNKIKKK